MNIKVIIEYINKKETKKAFIDIKVIMKNI